MTQITTVYAGGGAPPAAAGLHAALNNKLYGQALKGIGSGPSEFETGLCNQRPLNRVEIKSAASNVQKIGLQKQKPKH